MLHRSILLLLAVTVSAGVAGAQATDGRTFSWKGEVPAGSWLRIRNTNGSIQVLPASGNSVEVTAVKRQVGDGDDEPGDAMDHVRFEVKQSGSDVTICALWDEDGICSAEDYRSVNRGRRGKSRNVSVRFTVRLPRGVRTDAFTVNGSVEVEGAGAEVVARSVNGSIDVATARGPVNARTTNGSIVARMAAVDDSSDMEFESTNGAITIEVPSAFNADLELRTVNGGVRTDFPITLTGRINPRHLRATLGRGGRRVYARTVNGGIELRKR